MKIYIVQESVPYEGYFDVEYFLSEKKARKRAKIRSQEYLETGYTFGTIELIERETEDESI